MTTHNSQHSAEAPEAFTPQPLDIAMNTEATETPASWATSAIVTLFLPRTVTPPTRLCWRNENGSLLR